MVLQMMDVGPLTMELYDKTVYVYPTGAKAVGWILALSSILMIPIVAIITYKESKKSENHMNISISFLQY